MHFIRKTGPAVLALSFGVAALPVAAQDTVFLIRHADKELSGTDPGLTPLGKARAENWGDVLALAGIEAVFTSDARRTRQTGAVIADMLGVDTTAHDRTDTTGLLDLLSFDHEDDRILIVAHAETIPAILSGLGHDLAPKIPDTVFDNLFIASDTAVVHLKVPFVP